MGTQYAVTGAQPTAAPQPAAGGAASSGGSAAPIDANTCPRHTRSRAIRARNGFTINPENLQKLKQFEKLKKELTGLGLVQP